MHRPAVPDTRVTLFFLFLAAACQPPRPKEQCIPWDVRACDCPIGGGQQSCAGDGSGYEECVCPIKAATLQPGVTELKTDAASGIVIDGKDLHFITSPADPPPVKPNDLVVSWTGEGFIGRVSRVDQTPDGWLVQTEQNNIKLEDAFSELDIDFDGAMNIAGGLTKEERDQYFTEDKVGIGFGAGGFSLNVSGSLMPTMKIEPESSVRFQPYGTFKLSFKKVAGIPVDIKEFRFGIGLDAALKLVSTVGLKGQGSVSAEVEIFQLAQAIAGVPEPQPLSFPIAAGIAGRVYINLGCGLTVSGELELKSTFDAGVNAYGGVYWHKGNLRPETRLDKHFSGSLDSLDYSASAVLECYLRPRVGLNILRVFEVYVEEGPYANVGVHINKTPYTDFNVGFKGTIGAELGIEDLDLTFADVSYDLFDYSLQLWKKDFSICGDGYQQLDEDCDIGPFYTFHPNVPKPSSPWCGSDCKCAPGYAVYNLGLKDPPGQAWGSPTNYCTPACGNGRLDPGEACDPRMIGGSCDFGTGKGGCASDCSHKLGICGDGTLDEQCGERCDDGKNDCSGVCGSSCFLPPKRCGDSITDWNCGEECDDGNTNGGDGCSAQCKSSKFCGDGILGPFEQCDDGNTQNCDGCTAWCRVEVGGCGDGITCGDEECDTMGATYYCNAQCKLSSCGDGLHDTVRGEECDDGGETADCTRWCRVSRCGDNYVNQAAGEECDSGGVDTWSCDADCTLPSCGDNHVNSARETCDDGDASDCTTGCNYNCTRPAAAVVCGDGFVNGFCGETCDDGALNGTCGKCKTDCTGVEGVCGDGTVDTLLCGEVCDGGNAVSGDGCRSDCKGTEVCGDGFPDVNEICDDGDTGTCRGNCNSDCTAFYVDVCRDGVRTACELCDDTNPANTGVDAGCNAAAPHCNISCRSCSASVCGDGVVQAGEACEPVGECEDNPGISCTLFDTSNCPPGIRCGFPAGPGLCIDTCLRVQTCGDGFIDGNEACDPPGAACAPDCLSTL